LFCFQFAGISATQNLEPKLCFLPITANQHSLPEELTTILQSPFPERYPLYEIEWIGCADNHVFESPQLTDPDSIS
jgi:hypothetical protein